MTRLKPRTVATSAEMSMTELLRPLSARALPRSALFGKQGQLLSEAEAQARAREIHHNKRNGRRGVGYR